MNQLKNQGECRLRPLLFILLIGLTGLFVIWLSQQSLAAASHATQFPSATSSSQPVYGVNFITSAEFLADEDQYAKGVSTGATWNRWPLYWFYIEQSENSFNWSTQDAAVIGDVTHGLHTNAILLGTPGFYQTTFPQISDPTPAQQAGTIALEAPQTATPTGLYDPIFTDGSDIPGPGKMISSANKWARFVSLAVERYRPGGLIAQQQGWTAGEGVTLWEVWNEEDYQFFWDGTVPDYARLLKVAYIVINFIDPDAQVMFGGLSNINTPPVANANFYNEVMTIYDADPVAVENSYFHDVLATHSYFHAWNSWYHVWRANNTLATRGLDKPIWLNETGVTAWDDYPGPVWDPNSGLRATMSEQADYMIQTAFYSMFAGADAIFHFQLYDACGNQPAGTDFPPHNGELCDENGIYPVTGLPCAGDANGLFRNKADAQCFTQHPLADSARPNFEAYKVLTAHVTDVQPLWRQRPGGSDPVNGPQEWIAFYQPATNSRILGLWARFGSEETAAVPTTNSSGSGTLIAPDGTMSSINAVEGNFTLTLPAATNQNAPWDPTLYAIGGRPYLLVEVDDVPPDTALNGPVVAETIINLNWTGQDDGSGLLNYDLWVAVDSEAAVPWLVETNETEAVYSSEPFHTYTFTLYGRDNAGNISDGESLVVTALELTERSYLPQISR